MSITTCSNQVGYRNITWHNKSNVVQKYRLAAQYDFLLIDKHLYRTSLMPVPVLPQLLDIFCHLVIYFRAWVSQWSSTKPLFGASPLPCGFLKKCQQTIVECNPEVEVWFSHHATTFDELIGNKGGQIILALISCETSHIYVCICIIVNWAALTCRVCYLWAK